MRGSCHPDTPITPTVATPRPRRTALGDHSGCTDWTSLPLSCLLLWLHLCSSALTDQPWGARHPETKELHPGQGCLCVNWMNHTMDSWMQSVVKKKKKQNREEKDKKSIEGQYIPFLFFLSHSWTFSGLGGRSSPLTRPAPGRNMEGCLKHWLDMWTRAMVSTL